MSPGRELLPGWRIGASPFRQPGRNSYGIDVHGFGGKTAPVAKTCTSIAEDGEVARNVSFV